MFTNDIVGSSRGQNGVRDRHTVRLFAQGPPFDETPQEAADRPVTGSENDSPPRQLARYAKDAAESTATGMRVRIIYKRDRDLRGGDHTPFLDRRYAAARFTEVNEDYRHQHQGRARPGRRALRRPATPRRLPLHHARVARVNAAALAGLASAPTAPKDVRIHTGELSNDTALEWNANPEPDLAGYEIVYRDTVSPYWTQVIAVGRATRKTVPGLTKDNFMFGVRAVDRDGNRSPVSFPRPVRVVAGRRRRARPRRLRGQGGPRGMARRGLLRRRPTRRRGPRGRLHRRPLRARTTRAWRPRARPQTRRPRGPPPRRLRRCRPRQADLALALILGFMLFEVVVGALVHSLALLSDAAHMLTDAGAIGLPLVAIRVAASRKGGTGTPVSL